MKKTRLHPYPIIGLEIHVELKTQNKMFCQCPADYFGKPPNSQTCPVCLGLPGALPVPNKTAIDWTIKIARALNCSIARETKFDRKHYFYPDLPKGFQISQYDQPIGENGHLTIMTESGEEKTFRFHRIHLEEDTAKSSHSADGTRIDANRSGVPLVEIVTEADFHDASDVKIFLEELQTIIRYLDVANADMEKGDMRLEPNISIVLLEDDEVWDGTFPPYKVEVKNINSFRYAKQAVEFEVRRQHDLLKKYETPQQETRGYNEKKGTTVSQRVKEEAADYRYFPEPDIPPIELEPSYVELITSDIPELPAARSKRYTEQLGIKPADAIILTRDRDRAETFEQALAMLEKELTTMKKSDRAQKLAGMLVNKKIDGTLTPHEIAKQAAEKLAPKKTDLSALAPVLEAVIAEHPSVVTDYQSGKENAIMFLVGQVMRQMKGQADAMVVKEELVKKIK